MNELLSAGDVEVQAAVVGSYPKVLLFVLDDTACNIVAQRVLERDVLYVLEAVADGGNNSVRRNTFPATCRLASP